MIINTQGTPSLPLYPGWGGRLRAPEYLTVGSVVGEGCFQEEAKLRLRPGLGAGVER